MQQTSGANTRKPNTGNSTSGGILSEGGEAKGKRNTGGNAGRGGKYQHQTSNSSHVSGQTKQTQNQQLKETTPKSSAAQTGKDKNPTPLPASTPDWGFMEKIAQPKPEQSATVQPQTPAKPQGKQGKRGNFEKSQSNVSKDNQSNRQNGKDQPKKEHQSVEQLYENDDAIVSVGDPAPKKKRDRNLVKYEIQGADLSHQALNETDTKEKYDQFKDKKQTTYQDGIYSTQLDVQKLDKRTIEKGIKVEQEINQSQTQNRHQAEERNQVALQDDADEEQKYGAVDTLNQQAVGKLDGILTNMTTAKSKFKTFHAKIDKNAFDKMTQAGQRSVTQKIDSFFDLASVDQPLTKQLTSAQPQTQMPVSTTNAPVKPVPTQPAQPIVPQQVQSQIRPPVQQQTPIPPPAATTQPPSSTNPFMKEGAMKITQSEFKPSAASFTPSTNFQPSNPAFTQPRPFAPPQYMQNNFQGMQNPQNFQYKQQNYQNFGGNQYMNKPNNSMPMPMKQNMGFQQNVQPQFQPSGQQQPFQNQFNNFTPSMPIGGRQGQGMIPPPNGMPPPGNMPQTGNMPPPNQMPQANLKPPSESNPFQNMKSEAPAFQPSKK